MSTLARIIYEETGLTESGTPDEYEEVAAACRRFAMHDTETTDDTDDTALLRQVLEIFELLHGRCTDSDDGTVEDITVWCPEIIAALRARLGSQQ